MRSSSLTENAMPLGMPHGRRVSVVLNPGYAQVKILPDGAGLRVGLLSVPLCRFAESAGAIRHRLRGESRPRDAWSGYWG
jgi:hypothetical protein